MPTCTSLLETNVFVAFEGTQLDGAETVAERQRWNGRDRCQLRHSPPDVGAQLLSLGLEPGDDLFLELAYRPHELGVFEHAPVAGLENRPNLRFRVWLVSRRERQEDRQMVDELTWGMSPVIDLHRRRSQLPQRLSPALRHVGRAIRLDLTIRSQRLQVLHLHLIDAAKVLVFRNLLEYFVDRSFGTHRLAAQQDHLREAQFFLLAFRQKELPSHFHFGSTRNLGGVADASPFGESCMVPPLEGVVLKRGAPAH